MTAWDGKTFWAGYDRFRVGPESGNYKLSVTGYDRYSTVPNKMWYHNYMMFTTYDRDNDRSGINCARSWKGGWWYNGCFRIIPTGLYLSGGVCEDTGIMRINTPGYCPYYSFRRMTFTLIPQ